ncbi:hypothetical protein BV22DRAFT_1075129 [Leucogyrophana mollusca]|uniref:Uncharacterized protein n=1 Tax=Leucogyrophana mollusca TaxID=85980 RepID=A0ACB8B2R9_9AGAM|nr:hypothetical protein BV22DRAFT_1075129 [Leucogyrophana mollusca]
MSASWCDRIQCCAAGVHRMSTAGIHGSKYSGCYSIVLSISEVYKDDRDFGETVIYTGSGGREQLIEHVPGKRPRRWGWFNGPQTRDQNWTDQGNESLFLSVETGNPVRVIRSSKVVSPFAPAEGYRYDGLYTVMDAWKEKNDDGLIICRYRLERIPGQPPLPLRRAAGGDISADAIASTLSAIEQRRILEMPSGSTDTDTEDTPKKKRKKDPSSSMPVGSPEMVQPRPGSSSLEEDDWENYPLQRLHRLRRLS